MKKPKRNLKDAVYDKMIRIPINLEDLVKEPYFMNMNEAVHVDDSISITDIKSPIFQLIWEGDED